MRLVLWSVRTPPRLHLFDRSNLSPLVVPALRTHLMWQLRLMTLRALPVSNRCQRIVRPPLGGPCLGVTSFWVRHFVQSFRAPSTAARRRCVQAGEQSLPIAVRDRGSTARAPRTWGRATARHTSKARCSDSCRTSGTTRDTRHDRAVSIGIDNCSCSRTICARSICWSR